MTISLSEFQQRRARLLSQCEPNSICIVAASSLVTRSNDTEYPFRQNSDFWYLTGFNEPNAFLILSNNAFFKYNGESPAVEKETSSIVFVQPTDEHAEIWHGRRLGVDNAASKLGTDLAFDVDDIDEELVDIIDGHKHLYFSFDADPLVESTISAALAECRNAPKQSKVAPSNMHDIQSLLHAMRLLKSDAEIMLMQRAADISAMAHVRAMRFCQPAKFEYQLEAEIHHEFAMQSARSPAYGTIVGGGENACILHYTENADELSSGDLVLIDAGCELEGYAADITRTFPVNGKFSPVQKVLYQLVLDSQLAALEQLKPGNTISQAMKACVRVIVEGLVELGILSGSIEKNIEKETWRSYFMHGLGHWLGLDVHDVGIYKINNADRPLEAGMVMTVEPGIYIPVSANVDDKFKGIGIRIEDDIVITVGGNHVMTSKVPKTVSEIEALMAS
ncbi:Xaa-Pro aminopeptidase [Brumicola nitratireducens]|uniref:Xaa-Pro aminopeptidase n=1 Tax=Glaciecola nitratireducens (strain JCM 12485 / KCTC 12276 / FR1064) TaxID=1085623 RepID=G4QMA3_GLANF|nr:Xaa-Pro aminopeptidase [Glaciecola nitratireducens]AEP30755.1 proline aminopeptidase P II [Glaciecola nitratireducens FR1064]